MNSKVLSIQLPFEKGPFMGIVSVETSWFPCTWCLRESLFPIHGREPVLRSIGRHIPSHRLALTRILALHNTTGNKQTTYILFELMFWALRLWLIRGLTRYNILGFYNGRGMVLNTLLVFFQIPHLYSLSHCHNLVIKILLLSPFCR